MKQIALCSVMLVYWVISLHAWTPGIPLKPQQDQIQQWRWSRSDGGIKRKRTQGNYTCVENQACLIANVTSSEKIWLGPKKQGLRETLILHNGTVDLTIDSEVPLLCCLQPNRFPDLTVTLCENHRGKTHWELQANNTSILVCSNGTGVTNLVLWARRIKIYQADTTVVTTSKIKRIPATCIPVGTQSSKTILHVQITFPPHTKCSGKLRKKRAWYDTVLGGYGAVTGTLNGFDIETLANRMSNTGTEIHRAMTLLGTWLPTTQGSAGLQLGIDEESLSLIKQSTKFLVSQGQNISNFINWTVCSITTLMQQTQKQNMQTQLMTGNEQVWRQALKTRVNTSHWLHVEAEKLYCNDVMCKGKVIVYNVTKREPMCKYVVMALVMGGEGKTWYWQPKFNGPYIDSRNRTHDLSNCADTTQGKICQIQSAVYEPCMLQHSDNVCEWTILPSSYKMMIEIAPQTVCMTTDTPAVPHMKVPFSGCLTNVTIMVWDDITYYLPADREETVKVSWKPSDPTKVDWDIKLDALYAILRESEHVQRHIQFLNRTIAAHIVYTHIVGQKIESLGSTIEQATKHHWWDVFMGYSPSATRLLKAVLHPILGFTIAFIVLTLFNCFVSYKLWCYRPGRRRRLE